MNLSGLTNDEDLAIDAFGLNNSIAENEFDSLLNYVNNDPSFSNAPMPNQIIEFCHKMDLSNNNINLFDICGNDEPRSSTPIVDNDKLKFDSINFNMIEELNDIFQDNTLIPVYTNLSNVENINYDNIDLSPNHVSSSSEILNTQLFFNSNDDCTTSGVEDKSCKRLKSVNKKNCLNLDITSSHSLSDNELSSLSTPLLNQLLRGMSRQEQSNLKKRRRQLKNREYARTCRQRRVSNNGGLREENENLKHEIQLLKERNNQLQQLIKNLQSR